LGGCAAIGGKIYLVGGFVGDQMSSTCLEFDPQAAVDNAFVRKAPLNCGRNERFACVGC
jgi:hypothetical protein